MSSVDKIPSLVSDTVVKAIFEEINTLVDFTNILLPENLSLDIKTSSVLNSIQNSREKVCNPDLRVGDKNISVWIEFQSSYYSNTQNRVDVYSCGQLFSEVSVGSDYSNLKKSIVVWISNNSINKSQEKDYYQIVNKGDNLVQIFIELDRFRKHIKYLENLSELSDRDHVIFLLSFPDTYETLNSVDHRPALVKRILTLYKNYCTAYVMATRKRKIDPNLQIFGQNEKELEQSQLYKSAIKYLKTGTLPSKENFQIIFEDLGNQTINYLFTTYTDVGRSDVKPAKLRRIKNDTDDEKEKNKKCDNKVVEDVKRNSVEYNNDKEEDKEFNNRVRENYLNLNQTLEFNSIDRAQELIEFGCTDDEIKSCTYLNQSELISLRNLINRIENTTKVKIQTKEFIRQSHSESPSSQALVTE